MATIMIHLEEDSSVSNNSNHNSHAPSQTTTAAIPPQQGIDIQQALAILSARSETDPGANTESGTCPCCHAGNNNNNIPQSSKAMGQTIDLLLTTSATETTTKTKNEAENTQQQRGGPERREKLQAALHSLSHRELFRAVLQAQQDRVATYRDYERGLGTVLQTGNMTSYPDTCSKATAAFSVLSETIKMIQEILQQRCPPPKDDDPSKLSSSSISVLVRLIGTLQQQEKEKLHLTAAHHLERIRQRNQQLQSSGGDAQIEQLLQEGVQSLQQKIHTCVEHINDVLEEIRCCMLEEEEEQDE